MTKLQKACVDGFTFVAPKNLLNKFFEIIF